MTAPLAGGAHVGGMSGWSSNDIIAFVNYDAAFGALTSVYLEESWVLEVAPRVDGVAFRIEAVLTPEHTLYEAPQPGEQYCYRAGWLDVSSAEPVDVRLSGTHPAISADGSRDLGNIDRFVLNLAEDQWEMEGDWGTALLRDPVVELVLD